MGSLYWQLNDCWPTQSWSTVDYFGRWKASHYAARNANEAVIASIALEEDGLKVYVVSDLLQAVPAELQLTFITPGGERLKEVTLDLDVQPNQSQVAFETSLQSLFSEPVKEWILHTHITGEGIDHENHYAPFLPKDMEFPPVRLDYRVTRVDGEYEIELRSKGLIQGLSIATETEGIRLSDNFFDLLPGIPKVIKVPGNKSPGTLKFTSLNSIRAGEPQQVFEKE
jgi:beta-mannosidase